MAEKTALVTGASSGIGRTFAQELAKEGYLVTGVARSEDRLQALVAELGDGHRYLVADLADFDQLQRVVGDLQETGYSLFINNAGYARFGRFEEVPVEDHEHLMAVNMRPLIRLAHAFLKGAKAGDAMVTVSSTVGLTSYPGFAMYAASKAFLTALTEGLWYENKDRGVYVQALLPGVTDTEFLGIATDGAHKRVSGLPNYPPEVVVRKSMSELRKRKRPTVISGPVYSFLSFVNMRLLSRKRMVSFMGKNGIDRM